MNEVIMFFDGMLFMWCIFALGRICDLLRVVKPLDENKKFKSWTGPKEPGIRLYDNKEPGIRK